ncbi:MAG: 2-oxoacid:acceptor oxidoreductase family protein [Acidimicrobiales bacterium]
MTTVAQGGAQIASGTFQVRFHGRGGQGVVTAAEMLSVAAFLDGRYSQAFPSFGSERTGAPVVSYCRISEREIRTRAPIDAPDALVIQDATLVHQVDLFAGIREDGFILVNTSQSFDELGLGDLADRFHPDHLLTVPATEIALRRLGRPLPNAVLLGGFAVMTGVVTIDSVVAAIEERFHGAVAQGNAAAAREAAEFVAEERLARASSD